MKKVNFIIIFCFLAFFSKNAFSQIVDCDSCYMEWTDGRTGIPDLTFSSISEPTVSFSLNTKFDENENIIKNQFKILMTIQGDCCKKIKKSKFEFSFSNRETRNKITFLAKEKKRNLPQLCQFYIDVSKRQLLNIKDFHFTSIMIDELKGINKVFYTVKAHNYILNNQIHCMVNCNDRDWD